MDRFRGRTRHATVEFKGEVKGEDQADAAQPDGGGFLDPCGPVRDE